MISAGVQAECWFLDVGQGASTVVLLGSGRALVIDAGPSRSTVPLQLLRRHVHTIETLIITHNDDDHDGGVARILAAYPRAVKQLLFLEDRPAAGIKTFRLAQLERRSGRLLCEPQRLEAGERPRVLFSDASSRTELRLLYPTFLENLEAQATGDRRNRTSGVIVLYCGQRKIVLPGDATIDAWEAIASRMKSRLPLTCDLMAASHHGGRLASQPSGGIRHSDQVRRVYAEIVNARRVIVSVGSSNQHGHPVPETVMVLRQLGTEVICTQITPHCGEDLEAVRPGVVEPAWPSQSSRRPRTTGAGRSRDVGCAGSIVAEVDVKEVRIGLWASHQRRLQMLAADGTLHPLCLATCAVAT